MMGFSIHQSLPMKSSTEAHSPRGTTIIVDLICILGSSLSHRKHRLCVDAYNFEVVRKFYKYHKIRTEDGKVKCH